MWIHRIDYLTPHLWGNTGNWELPRVAYLQVLVPCFHVIDLTSAGGAFRLGMVPDFRPSLTCHEKEECSSCAICHNTEASSITWRLVVSRLGVEQLGVILARDLHVL